MFELLERMSFTLFVVGYLTTAMYYSYGQRQTPYVDGWYLGLDDILRPYDNRGQMWSKFPDIFRTVKRKPRKSSTRKLTRPKIEPRPTAWEVTMLPLDHSSGAARFRLRLKDVGLSDIKILNETSYSTNRHKYPNIWAFRRAGLKSYKKLGGSSRIT